MSRITGTLLLALSAATPAAAQESAVRSAADAFGERVGTEQSGLYNESEVRGFDLNDSGAYRIDDAYFSRAAPLNDPVLAGVGVRVGVNAARLAYPAPSGVVNYRLRSPGPVNEVRLGAGFRDFGTRVVQGDGSWKSEDDRFGLAGGFVWRPLSRWAPGSEGKAIDVGAVGSWNLAPGQRLRGFASLYRRRYDGDYAFMAADGAVPPDPRKLHQYSPDWARVEAMNSNLGLLYDGRFGGWTVDLAAFRSQFDSDGADFTIIETRANGEAFATTYRAPGRRNISDSAEARVGRQFNAGGFSHLITASVRGRRSRVDLSSSVTIPLGAFNIADDTPDGIERPWTGTRGLDEVKQVTGSLGYGLAWGDRAQVRAAAHRTRYDKEVLSKTGARSEGVSETTLYNASAILSLTRRTAVFGSWVTGLEESGVAPTSATNRDEVLPPVEAEQFELGVRHNLTPDLAFIGALFDVSKPTSGVRADGSFGHVGRVRHRGVEGSLAGQLDAKTSVVLGAVAFTPKITGPLVDAGVVGSRAAGISNFVANASIERQIAAGWSLDAQISYSGARWADTANTFKTPAVTTLSLGARRRFELAGRPAQFRVLASNINGADGYWASPSGLLWPIAPRTVRAMLTLTFGPGT
jgi:iron complex outermembrane receptor protein